MADVERERVTALWREAAAALDRGDDTRERIARGLRTGRDRRRGDERDYDYRRALAVDGLQALDTLAAECLRLREQLDTARTQLGEVEYGLENLRGWWPDGKLVARQAWLTHIEHHVDAARAALGVEGEQADTEAECERLREQLDAARQALEKIAAHDSDHLYTERCVPVMIAVARAALGVEGKQEKPT